jgi:hypothetical protein
MQFKVPQFLDIEDKIFGPFTFTQFVYLTGGGGLCYIIYKFMGLLFGFVPIILVASFALALTFYKPNNKPFLHLVQSIVSFYVQSKLYIWKQRNKKVEKKENNYSTNEELGLTRSQIKLNKSKLRDLSWGLDVLDIKKNNKNS